MTLGLQDEPRHGEKQPQQREGHKTAPGMRLDLVALSGAEQTCDRLIAVPASVPSADFWLERDAS